MAEQDGKSGPMTAGILDSIVLSKVREQLGMDQVELAITASEAERFEDRGIDLEPVELTVGAGSETDRKLLAIRVVR